MKRLLGFLALAAVVGALVGRVGVAVLLHAGAGSGEREAIHLAALKEILLKPVRGVFDFSGSGFSADRMELEEPVLERGRAPVARSPLPHPLVPVRVAQAAPVHIPFPPRYHLYCILRT